MMAYRRAANCTVGLFFFFACAVSLCRYPAKAGIRFGEDVVQLLKSLVMLKWNGQEWSKSFLSAFFLHLPPYAIIHGGCIALWRATLVRKLANKVQHFTFLIRFGFSPKVEFQDHRNEHGCACRRSKPHSQLTTHNWLIPRLIAIGWQPLQCLTQCVDSL